VENPVKIVRKDLLKLHSYHHLQRTRL